MSGEILSARWFAAMLDNMAADKHQKHIHILPEDDANRELANGFSIGLNETVARRIQVLPVAGGWINVLDKFLSNHVKGMQQFHNRFMILLIDFDRDVGRLEFATNRIPQSLRERVFILGSVDEPQQLIKAGCYKAEDLKRVGSKLEAIGYAMARACREETAEIWDHELLCNNAAELTRLKQFVRPILFQSIPGYAGAAIAPRTC